jgi:hypothetical protein
MTATRHLGARKPVVAQQGAVARDHEINLRERLRRHRLEIGRAGCRGMGDEESQRRREPFDLRGPIRQQRGGRHQQARGSRRRCRPLRRRFVLENQEQRQYLDGFAQSHVVRETGAKPEAVQQVEPTDAGLLIGPQCRLERRSRLDAGESVGLRRPLRVSASQGPALTVDQSGSGGSPGSSSSTATPATSRMASANGSPPSAAAASILRNRSRSCLSLPRSTSTQRPRKNCSPSDPLSRARISLP